MEHALVGRYRSGERIGRGGFGSVHRGVAFGAAGFEKPVAIKFLDAGADEMLPRLRDEARLLGHLRHRAIVGVDDLIELDGRWAVVMELVDGQDLARILGVGAVPPRAACELVAEAAAGLEAAHTATDSNTGAALHLVHRDVKPSNLRVTPRGEVKLLDFGVACATFATREATTRSLAFGTPGYLSPERHDGVDTPAADVYALGVVYAECLLGERLGPSSVDPHRHAEWVANVVDRLPPALRDTVAEMLAYAREERPAAAEVSRRVAALAPTFDGPSLAEWAPDAVEAAGKLPVVEPPSLGTPRPTAPTAPQPSPEGRARRSRLALFAGAALVFSAGAALVLSAGAETVLLTGAEPVLLTGTALVISAGAEPVAGLAGAGSVGLGSATSPIAEAAPLVAEAPHTPVAAPAAAPAASPDPPPMALPARPEAAPPAARPAVSVGAVVVDGDADDVSLVGPSGTRAPGRRVPAGSWLLVARFGDVTVHPPDPITVTPGATVHVRCLRAVENCVVDTPEAHAEP